MKRKKGVYIPNTQIIELERGAVMVFHEDGLPFVMVDPKKPYQRALWKRHFGFALDRFLIDHVRARQRAIEAGEQWVRLEEVP